MLEVEDHVMKISLREVEDVARVDITLDGQEYGRYVVSGFDYFEIPLDGFLLTDTLLELDVHDKYMNTQYLAYYPEKSSTDISDLETVRGKTFNAYPNPVHTDLHLEFFNGEGGEVLASLYSMSGQLETERSLHLGGGMAKMNVDMGGMQAGHYLVVVRAGTQYYSMPVVKY
jgi:hypothetical protein